MNDPQYELTGSEDMITLPDVRARIARLKPYHVENILIPESAVVDPSVASYATREEAEEHIQVHGPALQAELEVVTWSDEELELTALRDLEAELAGLGSGDHATAVNDSHLEDFVRQEYEALYGTVIDDLDIYLDWDKIRTDRTVDWPGTCFRGYDFHLVP